MVNEVPEEIRHHVMKRLFAPILIMLQLPAAAQPPISVEGIPPTPDFDGNGVIDGEDYKLFSEGFGSANLRFDLNGDGNVDFGDLFLFADRIEVEVDHEDLLPVAAVATSPEVVEPPEADKPLESDKPPATEPVRTGPVNSRREIANLPYTIATVSRNREILIELPDFEATISRRAPFGVTRLRLARQPVDFAHAELPLADWEWFWFERANGLRAER